LDLPFVVGDLSPDSSPHAINQSSKLTNGRVVKRDSRYLPILLFRQHCLRAIKYLTRQKFRGAKLLPEHQFANLALKTF